MEDEEVDREKIKRRIAEDAPCSMSSVELQGKNKNDNYFKIHEDILAREWRFMC